MLSPSDLHKQNAPVKHRVDDQTVNLLEVPQEKEPSIAFAPFLRIMSRAPHFSPAVAHSTDSVEVPQEKEPSSFCSPMLCMISRAARSIRPPPALTFGDVVGCCEIQ